MNASRKGRFKVMNMTEWEFDHHAWENKCVFLFDRVDAGLRITEVYEYIAEEGWDDEDDPAPGDVTLPDTIDGIPIVEIGKGAFEHQPGIGMLRLSDEIRIVRESGMGGRHLVIPAMPAQLQIAESNAFSGTIILNGQFPETLEEIGAQAFYGCRGLESVQLCEGLIMLDDSAFGNCKNMTHVCLPASLSLVGEGIFMGCDNLRCITLARGSKALSMIDNFLIRNEDQTLIAWAPCADDATLQIPDGVRRIGDYTFSNCARILSVTFPDSVAEIGECAFKGCTSLREIQFGVSLVRVECDTFGDCVSLENVPFPDSVVEIGAYAFRNCRSLKSLFLPDGVKKVEEMAFENCKALRTASVSERIAIDRSAFDGCWLSDFAIRGNPPPRTTSLKELVDGVQHCEAELLAIVNNMPYHFVNRDEIEGLIPYE